MKLEWGIKRTCQSCGVRFYDLRHDPIVCPKCEAVFDVEALQRPRRPRPAAPVVAEIPVEPAVVNEATDEVEAVDEEAGIEEEEAEAVIEDTSELGEDDDDMAEVIDKVEDEDER